MAKLCEHDVAAESCIVCEVLMLREKCARQSAALKIAEEALWNLLEPQDTPCRFDHHGYCQEHNLGSPCEVEGARSALAAIKKEARHD